MCTWLSLLKKTAFSHFQCGKAICWPFNLSLIHTRQACSCIAMKMEFQKPVMKQKNNEHFMTRMCLLRLWVHFSVLCKYYVECQFCVNITLLWLCGCFFRQVCHSHFRGRSSPEAVWALSPHAPQSQTGRGSVPQEALILLQSLCCPSSLPWASQTLFCHRKPMSCWVMKSSYIVYFQGQFAFSWNAFIGEIALNGVPVIYLCLILLV